MRPEERRQEIMKHLNERGIAKVTELSEIFQVTEETIRRDLEYLEGKGYLKRTHGGAYNIKIGQEETAFYIRNMRNRLEKQSIGKVAAELVQPGDVIAVDASTTALQFVYFLKEKKDIVVITHAIKVVMALEGNRDITVICTGGTLQPRTLSFVGPLVESALSNYNIRKAFISCKGITLEEGITESTELQAKVKQEMLKAAKETVLLVDHDKFGTTTLTTVAPVTAVNKIITDAGTPKDELDELKKLGIEIIVVPRPDETGGVAGPACDLKQVK